MVHINFKFGRIIALMQRLTHSNSADAEYLYIEVKDILPEPLSNQIFELISNPFDYEDDYEFLDEIIQGLKSEL